MSASNPISTIYSDPNKFFLAFVETEVDQFSSYY